MASCAGNNTVAALIAGSIDAAAAKRLEHHLDECVTCRELVADLGRGLSAIGDGARGGGGGADRLPRVGEQLGRYTIRRVIGVGGMGVVYEAHDTTLARRVAVKLLRPDLVDEQLSGDQLLAEAQAMARLQHPNIAVVHDVGLHHGQLYVCMEYVDGSTLRDWLGEQPRTWRAVLEVFLAAGRGLAYVHAAGLVHLDFKPDNVLLGRSGRVLVSDFGLARVIGGGDRQLPGTVGVAVAVGTPAYMAPEQRRGELTDARSDQFGFCAALVEALGGRHTPGDVRLAVPAGVRNAIARGLAPRPVDRFPSMEALLEALAATLRPARRRALVAVLAVAAVAITAGVATRGGDTVTRFVDRPTVERVVEDRIAPALGVPPPIDEISAAADVTAPRSTAPAAVRGDDPIRGPVLSHHEDPPRVGVAAPGEAALATSPSPRAGHSAELVAVDLGSVGGGTGTGARSPPGLQGSPGADGCNDGTPRQCTVREPSCPPTTVAAIRDGCWTCADANTCASLGLPESCDDHTALVCTTPPPVCPGRGVVAIHNGCWRCADPFTCNLTDPHQPPPTAQCGNGFCEQGETHASCPADCCELSGSGAGSAGGCAPTCGNGFCEQGEDHTSCPADCCELTSAGVCAATCGNGFCESGETHASCPADCCEPNADGSCMPICGNGMCELDETPASCPADCH